ncbi:sugar phosphate isomerase/epimerase family protein [Aquisphaera insulae]|uniref:sugar phosphate isomerase/epimerase family protein n=1 Tax=Aquisphaera insulae TaxID=2712864 RepID=UPI00196B5192|nr:TIM barrel protein [Aquisphaera insulae]
MDTEATRRQFLRASAGAAGVLALGRSAATASPLGLPIGCQVWPTRSMLGDLPAYVRMMAGIGVTRLELCSPIGYGGEFASLKDGKEVRKILGDHGIESVSSHFSMAELRRSQARSIDWAKEVGINQMLTATLGDGNGGDSPTLDQVKRAAEEYNRIAEAAAAAGVQQGLHNEGFEVSMVDGQRTYDLLLKLLDPKLVTFQFQMSTIENGLVAADYFLRYPGRFHSMHLQDIDMKSAPPASKKGRPGRRPQVALGEGSIDWSTTFDAAKKAGVRSYYVEQTWALTQRSVAYLKKFPA